MTLKTIGIIIPCFDEEEVLTETNRQLVDLLHKMKDDKIISSDSYIVYIDDGSRDKTWEMISKLSQDVSEVHGIKLSRNQGHQNALLSGLLTSPGDALISADADLQDDLSIIPDMVKSFISGSEVVYGVRKIRKSDTFLKRFTAETYYKVMLKMGVDIIYNHSDYRLLGRKALNALSEYSEVNLFLRGLVRLVGHKSDIIEYERKERFAGESKYPLIKMLSFAWQGITSFSVTPLRIITGIGIVVSFFSSALGIWGLINSLFYDRTIPGWASTIIPIYFLGGIQLLCLGIIGEYVSKVYLESKKRPRFHIEKLLGNKFKE